jgi:hypothetical protein
VVHAVSAEPNPSGGYTRLGVAIPQYAHCVDPVGSPRACGRGVPASCAHAPAHPVGAPSQVLLRDNKTWLLFHNGDGSTTGVCPAGWWGCGTAADQGNKDGYVADCTHQGNGSTPSGVRGRRAPRPPAGFESSNGVHVSTRGPAGPWEA